jgi:surface-anchored protein
MPNFFIGIAMKKRTLLSVVSLESRLAPAGLPLIPLANVLDVQHVDLLSVYSGGWGLANKDHDANRTLAAAESLLFANAKSAMQAPSSGQLADLFRASGDKVWRLPQTSPQGQSLYLGLSSEGSNASQIKSRTINDPRLGEDSTSRWIEVRLLSLRNGEDLGPAPGTLTVYATNAQGDQTVWMASGDGLSATDNFYLVPGQHSHLNWVLSEPGLYCATFEARAQLSDGSFSTSNPIRYYFAAVTPNSEASIGAPGTLSVPFKVDTSFGNSLAVNDLTQNPYGIEVEFAASKGKLSLGATSGITFLQGDGLRDPFVRFHGSISDVNKALKNATYHPESAQEGDAEVVLRVNDRGFYFPDSDLDGYADNRLLTEKKVRVVVGANSPPVLSVPGNQKVDKGGELEFTTARGNQVRVSDPDGANPIQVSVRLPAGHGSIAFPDLSGIEVVAGSNQSSEITIRASQEKLNAALEGVRYRPGLFSGSTTIEILANDLGNNGDGEGNKTTGGGIGVEVRNINLPPMIQCPVTISVPVSSDYPLIGEQSVILADPDSGSGLMRLTAQTTNGLLSFSVRNGVRWLLGDGDRDSKIEMEGTLSDLQSVVGSLVFHSPTSPASAKLDLTLNDMGNSGSDGPKVTTVGISLDVRARNTAPEVVFPVGRLDSVSGGSVTLSASFGNRVVVRDADSGDGKVKATLSLTPGYGTLTLLGGQGITFVSGDGNSDQSMVFEGTIGAIQATLDAGLLVGLAQGKVGDSLVVLKLDDLGNTGAGGALTGEGSMTIRAIAPNREPVLEIPALQTVGLGSDLVFSLATGRAIRISDPDAGNGSLQIGFAVSSGLIIPRQVAGVEIVGSGTGDVVLKGSLAALNQAMDGLVYRSGLQEGEFPITVSANDLGSTGFGGPKVSVRNLRIQVLGINQAPSIIADSSSYLISEDNHLGFGSQGAGIKVQDPDSGDGKLYLEIEVSTGKLLFGSEIPVESDGKSKYFVTASVDKINQYLSEINFSPETDFNGQLSIQFRLDDLGNAGIGGAKKAVRTFTINVAPVNDPPAPRDDEVALRWTSQSVFVDVLANDSPGPGETGGLVIESVDQPANGKVEILGGKLFYLPKNGYTGSDHFTYTIKDEGGLKASANVKVAIKGVDPAIAFSGGPGGDPNVEVIDYQTGSRKLFRVFDEKYRGGVRSILGDVTGDGVADVVATTTVGAPPHVVVIDGSTGKVVSSFFAFEVSYLGGVNLGVVDLDGDGKQEVLMGAGLGASPHVVAMAPGSNSILASFFAFDPFYRGGVTPTGVDWDGDGRGEILVYSGFGSRPHIMVKDGSGLQTLASFYAFDPGYRGRIFVDSVASKPNFPENIYIAAMDSPGGHTVAFSSGDGGKVNLLSSKYMYGQVGFGGPGYIPPGGFRIAFRGGAAGGSLVIPAPWAHRGELWIVDTERPSLIKDRVFSRLDLGSFAYFSGV